MGSARITSKSRGAADRQRWRCSCPASWRRRPRSEVVLRPKETKDVECQRRVRPRAPGARRGPPGPGRAARDATRPRTAPGSSGRARSSSLPPGRHLVERPARRGRVRHRPGSGGRRASRARSSQEGDPRSRAATCATCSPPCACSTPSAPTASRYVPDPNKPFSARQRHARRGRPGAVPAQLLASRTGDCDDMSVLYCALLENLGVPTAFLDGPGHILMLFDTGRPRAQRARAVGRRGSVRWCATSGCGSRSRPR